MEDSARADELIASQSKISFIDFDGVSVVASLTPSGTPESSPQLVGPDELEAILSSASLDDDFEPDLPAVPEQFVDPQGPMETGPGTFTFSVPALSCVAQGGELSGDVNNCGGGGTLRTNGDSNFPCAVRSPSQGLRTTYICELELPSGAQIDEVTAHGLDFSTDGYMEAAIWRTQNTTFGPNYFSPTFGGSWQNSGIAASPGSFSFPVYLNTDAPHTVQGNYRYTLGFAMEYETGALFAYGFQVTYTIP